MALKMLGHFAYCSKCLNVSFRPRILFDENQVCNACLWAEEKKKINWQERKDYFAKLCDKYRKPGDQPDVIVPWSGGKDSIYVAYKMLEFGMKPLLLCVVPHLELEIGQWNRLNMCRNMEKIFINLNESKYRTLSINYFTEQGRPKHPWETAISAVVIRQAAGLNIPFIIYGEEGEQEYGGVVDEKDKWMLPVDKNYLWQYYWQGNLDWELPKEEDMNKIFFTQYSRFENWQPSLHANFAIAKGMRTEPVRSIGTLTTSSQLSDKLQDLHMYLAYLKFGFGRCTADVNIAIRDLWMTRDEAVAWVSHYDGEYPRKYHEDYLSYFGMNNTEFWAILNSFANKEILCPSSDPTKPWKLKDHVKIGQAGLVQTP